jgi:hypothetical protein
MKHQFWRNEYPDMLRFQPHIGYVKGLRHTLDFYPLASIKLCRIGGQQDCGMDRQNMACATPAIPPLRRQAAIQIGYGHVGIEQSQAKRCRKYFGVT